VVSEQKRTRAQLVAELEELGQRVSELEGAENERKQAEESLLRRSREMALLNRVGRELAATLDLRQVLERLLQEVTEIVGTEGASVWLWDEEQEGYLVCWAFSAESEGPSLIDQRLRPGQGIAGWVAESGRSVMVDPVQDSPRFFRGVDEELEFSTRSLIAVPLRVRDLVVGVLEVVNKLDGRFDDTDLALAETLAASAAIAIDNARMVEALRGYATELEARNADLDAFAHTVAHDLNNPLTRIIGFAGILEEELETLSQEDVRRYLHTIAQAAHKMRIITDELLLLSSVRLEEIELEPLDMAEIVSEVLNRLAYQIELHQAEIVVPESWPVALGYSTWIEEVWVNYISNAIKYGGRPPRVELGATDGADGTVRFWVRDNGYGLTRDEQARLFTPFTRLDKVSATGHGLGLSIVRRIMEKLGGKAGVESKVGLGSLFTFTLPGIDLSSG
jgi:signal transduction histidine kinase